MFKKKKIEMRLVELNGIYFRTVVEGLYIQVVLFCVIQTVDMATLPPTFNIRKDNITATVGENVLLPCSIMNLGNKEVIWKKTTEEHPITVGTFDFIKDPSFSVKHIPHKDDWNLLITNVQLKHAGKYECQVSTKDDMHRYVTLNVLESERKDMPQLVIENYAPNETTPGVKIEGPKAVLKGHPIRLTCNVTGAFHSKALDWFKGGFKVSSNPVKNIDVKNYWFRDKKIMHSVLVVSSSRIKDSGTYICRSSNVLKTHELEVLDDTQKKPYGGTNNKRRVTDPSSNAEMNSGLGNHNSSTRCKPLHAILYVCLLIFLTVLI